MPSEYTICVTLTDELIRKVRERAEEDTIPVSAVVRQALKRYFFATEGTHRPALVDSK